MSDQQLIIFVCEHGAAKSIVAASHFNKLAAEKNVAIRAIARGTIPDNELSPKAVQGLADDGLVPTESAPHKITLADVESAQRIVSFCDLPEEYRQTTRVERWSDIPPVSNGYEQARDMLAERIQHLLSNE